MRRFNGIFPKRCHLMLGIVEGVANALLPASQAGGLWATPQAGTMQQETPLQITAGELIGHVKSTVENNQNRTDTVRLVSLLRYMQWPLACYW